MKKIMTLVAVAAAAVGMAVAAPVLNVHGYFGEGWGSEINGLTLNDSTKMDLMDNLYYGGGVGVNFTINGSFGVQPEVNFYVNNIGYEKTTIIDYTVPVVGTRVYSKTITDTINTYNTIDIPVLLTYRYNKFNLALGPYISIPVTPVTTHGTYVAIDGVDNPTTTQGSLTSSTTDISSKVLFGLTGGLEYEQRMGMGRLTYGARYLLDFTPVQYQKTTNNSDGTTTTTTVDMFTRRALEIIVGYKIAL